MTLHEAIEAVLRQNKQPLSAKAIAQIINGQDYYVRNDGMPVGAKQILSRVSNYPSLFDTINGQIVLVEDKVWKNILINFGYLGSLLKSDYPTSDVQFILAVLLFYKRHLDLNKSRTLTYMLPDFNLIWKRGQEDENNYQLNRELENLEVYELGPPGIFRECASLLNQLKSIKKIEMFEILSKIDTTELDDQVFGDAFEYFLNMFPNDKGNMSLSPTPYSLRELMINILAPSPHSSIHDPVAGTGGLLIEAFRSARNRDIYLSGNEIITRIAQLGNMNLIMHGILNVTINNQDSFNTLAEPINYDYIIADLPNITTANSYEKELLFRKFGLLPPRSGNAFGSLVLLILSKMKLNGKAIMTVSDSFLVKKGKDFEIRQLLLDHDLIESVISLPHGTLKPYTEAKASLLILNNHKAESLKNKIRFITGKITEGDRRSSDLNSEDILSAYQTEELLSKDSQILDVSELRPDANLSADSYDEQYFLGIQMLKDGVGRFLSDLVIIKAGIQPEKSDIDATGEYPLVKIENLSRDILETDLTSEIPTRAYLSPRYQRSIINERCILIARIGDRVKATIFNPEMSRPSILIHSGIYAIIPINQNNIIDLEYLYYQLYSSFVLEQIKKRKLGAVMPSISIGSLKEIIIPYVDIANQKKFIESQKANLISEEKHRANAVLKALGSKDEIRQSETEIVKTLTHQLRPKFMEINSLASRIKRVVDNEGLNKIMEHNGNDDSDDPEIESQIQRPDNYPLEKLIDKMLGDSEHLSNVLSIVDKVMNFRLSEEDLVETNILELLNEYKQRKDIAINHRFEIVVKGEGITAEINSAALTDLLDQLLQNAEDHGFVQGLNKKFRVQFTVKAVKSRGVVSIEYNNNGAPYELEQKDFVNAFEKGRASKGSGIGGNYINRIIEAHGGKLTVVENNLKGFALTIELPINIDKTYE
ncbi:MAG: N-6 DNA methylase [Chryseobacterium sp.]|nr:N-6 DNA methylase [Chryseobacterium sp.]